MVLAVVLAAVVRLTQAAPPLVIDAFPCMAEKLEVRSVAAVSQSQATSSRPSSTPVK